MTETGALAGFALLLYLAYLASRVLARRQVPEIVVFLAVGAVAGPSALGLLSADDLTALRPVTTLALATLMFIIGERASTRALRRHPWMLTAAIGQWVAAGGAVFAASRAVGAEPAVAVLLAVLAGSGAPMTVAALVGSLRSRTPYAEGLVGTHAVSDALAALSFAALLPLASLLVRDSSALGEAALRFARLGIGGLALGAAVGWVVARLGPQIETSGELLLFVGVHLLAMFALSELTGVSVALAALVAGAVASSLATEDFSQRLFRAVGAIAKPLYLVFFALAGAAIHLDDLSTLGAEIGVYVVARVAGKVAGSVLGGPAGGLGLRASARLGVDALPQGGVAVGLAVLASEELAGPGGQVAAVVLGAVVFFELIGPMLVARHLRRGDLEAAPERPRPGRLPETVVLASPVRSELPGWVVDMCSRWGSRLVTLTPRPDDDLAIADLRRRARDDEVDLDVHALGAESFTGEVTRLAETVDAGLVVILTSSLPPPGARSRLVLLPHERVARNLSCPVVTVPVGGESREH